MPFPKTENLIELAGYGRQGPRPIEQREVWTRNRWVSHLQGRIFPHCPRCASFALYRKNNAGEYQCETCGLTGISETVARRIQ